MNSFFNWFKKASHNKVKIIVVIAIGCVSILTWVVLQPEVPSVKNFTTSYTPDAQYSVGFCASLQGNHIGLEGNNLEASINNTKASLNNKIISGADSGYYCFAADTKIKNPQRVNFRLTFNGDDVLDRNTPLAKPQAPRVYAVMLQPDMKWKSLTSPAKAIAMGRYLNNFKLQIGINNHWYPLGIMQKSMSAPDISGMNGSESITQTLYGAHIVPGQRVYVSVKRQSRNGWKVIYSRLMNAPRKK